MYSRTWLVIRDDGSKTFEVYGQDDNTDHFTNLVQGMQRQKMAVTAMLLPVTNKFASKQSIQVTGYRVEEGLYARLMKEYQKRVRGDMGAWDDQDFQD